MKSVIKLFNIDLSDDELCQLDLFQPKRCADKEIGFDAQTVMMSVILSVTANASYDVIKNGVIYLRSKILDSIKKGTNGVVSIEIDGIRYRLENEEDLDHVIDEIIDRYNNI